MIEEIKFKKGFELKIGQVEYEVRATPTEDHPVYRILVTDHFKEECYDRYLTYSEIVYIMFNAE